MQAIRISNCQNVSCQALCVLIIVSCARIKLWRSQLVKAQNDRTRFELINKVSSLRSADCLARRTHTSRRSRSPPPAGFPGGVAWRVGVGQFEFVHWEASRPGSRVLRYTRFCQPQPRSSLLPVLQLPSFPLGIFSFGAGFKVWIRSRFPLSCLGNRLGLCPDQGSSRVLWISSQADI